MNRITPALILATSAIFSVNAQTAAQQPGTVMGEKVTITIDSIDSGEGYVLVTTMSANFSPVDFAMRPAKVGSLLFMLNKPANNAPFSVMAYHDTNGNRHLDLNENNIPIEKCTVAHFTGEELEVSAALKYYDKLLNKTDKTKSIYK